MFKYFSSSFLLVVLCGGSVIQVPPRVEILTIDYEPLKDFWTTWGPGIMEFVELVDLERIMGILVQYLNDPEVMNFVNFIIGSEFRNVVMEFESLAEFKEAVELLQSEGYDVQSILNFINNALQLPPYDIPKKDLKPGKGLSGLFEEIMATLPVEDIQKLFEQKLESNKRLAEIFETINSEEFMDIMRRMSQNPKFSEIKEIFKGYGFDFKFLCDLAKSIFGKYYQGIFCE